METDETHTNNLTEAQLTVGPPFTDAEFKVWLAKPDYDFNELYRRFAIEKPTTDADPGDLRGGKVINDELPQKIHDCLDHAGSGYKGRDYDGDKSRQDSAVIAAMLSHISPDDAYATFTASERGRDAMVRHRRNYHDYLARTILNAQKFVGANGKANRLLRVDFSLI